jgi:NAD(P)-dependent dehydrogenase (short-subunit alcohol dehydrogenase family)
VEQFEGKVAVVTAGASGMGLSMARRFARAGMKIVLADRDEPGLDEAVAGLVAEGTDAVGVVTDVADPAAVDHLRDVALERHGTVHVLCSHAGGGGGGPISQPPVDFDGWHRGFEVSMFGVLHGVNAFLPIMLAQDEGHIVNTSSRQGLVITPMLGSYCPSKFAVVAATEMLEAELRAAGSNVGVSVLCPGGVRTNTLPHPDTLPAGIPEDRRQLMAQRYAEAAEPDDVAELVFAAIRQQRLHILTHAETVDWMQERFDRLKADMAALGTPR